jgi:dTDP-4-dehydrorhamnose 3,5-epimerase
MPIFSGAHLNNRSARDRQTFYFDAIGGRITNIAPREDERCFFVRAIGVGKELAARGPDTKIAQESISYNWLAGTVRGLHFHDRRLRPHSCSYLRWQALELTAEKRRAVYIPNTGFRP